METLADRARRMHQDGLISAGLMAKLKRISEDTRTFAATVTSGPAASAVVRARVAVCTACEHNRGGYCGACRCPSWRFNHIEKRAGFARNSCPKGKWEN